MIEFWLGVAFGGLAVGIAETLACLYLIGWLDRIVGGRISATLNAMNKRREATEQF